MSLTTIVASRRPDLTYRTSLSMRLSNWSNQLAVNSSLGTNRLDQFQLFWSPLQQSKLKACLGIISSPWATRATMKSRQQPRLTLVEQQLMEQIMLAAWDPPIRMVLASRRWIFNTTWIILKVALTQPNHRPAQRRWNLALVISMLHLTVS